MQQNPVRKKRYLRFIKDHPEAGKVIGDVVEETPETRRLVGRGLATRIRATEKRAKPAPKAKSATAKPSPTPTRDGGDKS